MSAAPALIDVVSDAAVALDGIAEGLEAFDGTKEIVSLIRDAEALTNVLWAKLEAAA